MNWIPGNPLLKLASPELICKLVILDATVEIYAAPQLGDCRGIFSLESADKKIQLQGGIDTSCSLNLLVGQLSKAYVELVTDQMNMAKRNDGTRADH